MEIGTVIASLEGPSPSKFSFVVTDDGRSIPVRLGQFVEVQTEEGNLIAFVTNLVKTNRYFMRVESVREYERGGKSLSSIFPADRWEYLVAEAQCLGVRSENRLERTTFPPSPGQRVCEAEPNTLVDFIGLSKDGVSLGDLRHHKIPVNLDLTRLLRKHLAVLAMSGAGKSNFASVLIEELLARTPEIGRPAIVIVDVHGEYKGLASLYPDKVEVVNGNDLKIGVPNMNAYQFTEFLPEISGTQTRELQRILEELRAEMRAGNGPFGMDELIARVEKDGGMHKQLQQALVGWLYELRAFGLFDCVDKPSWEGMVRPGKAIIIDFSDMTNLRKKQMLLAYAARKLFNARKRGRVPPFVLCLEEAHQFVPSGESKTAAIARPIIETIAREGRKFYASLMLISQRPVRLSTTVLSQANTNIILRVSNPYDIEHIRQSSEAITGDVADMISSLPVGEALVVGEAVNHPIFVKIKRRRSKEAGRESGLQEAAREFESKMNRSIEDARAFL